MCELEHSGRPEHNMVLAPPFTDPRQEQRIPDISLYGPLRSLSTLQDNPFFFPCALRDYIFTFGMSDIRIESDNQHSIR